MQREQFKRLWSERGQECLFDSGLAYIAKRRYALSLRYPSTRALALPLFTVTNADDLVLLTIYFGNPKTRTAGHRHRAAHPDNALTIASIVIARLALNQLDTLLPLLGLASVVVGVRDFFLLAEDDELTARCRMGCVCIVRSK